MWSQSRQCNLQNTNRLRLLSSVLYFIHFSTETKLKDSWTQYFKIITKTFFFRRSVSRLWSQLLKKWMKEMRTWGPTSFFPCLRWTTCMVYLRIMKRTILQIVFISECSVTFWYGPNKYLWLNGSWSGWAKNIWILRIRNTAYILWTFFACVPESQEKFETLEMAFEYHHIISSLITCMFYLWEEKSPSTLPPSTVFTKATYSQSYICKSGLLVVQTRILWL